MPSDPTSRTCSLAFKETPARDKQIRDAAKSASQSLSEYLRKALEKALPPPR